MVSADRNWKKDCPICHREQYYNNRSNWLRATKKSAICIWCLNQRKTQDKEYIQKLSASKLGNKNPSKRMDVREKISRANKGKHIHTDEFRHLVSILHKGKITSALTKQKMRTAVLQRIQQYGTRARNFNPSACKIIDDISQQYNYKFQHALNGGEIIVSGYSLDGYDKDKNVVIEYDECGTNHFDNNGNLKTKDINRMCEIIKSLHCKFLRYNEKTKQIIEYNNEGQAI